ncbi:MFS transporter [Bacteroides sp. 214]|uniref:MFS transporter n=1 Tax=Bacteroides sp. 214 TaxID=2302935 RepID=UPI0013D2CF7A|nr:MFS transporter [Bacteroides sp. 214]NDW11948.1 MFS transporter [Bacteroides sp. 214]
MTLLAGNFKRICFGNMLMYISQYMLLPTIPVVITERLNGPLAYTGVVFLLLLSGVLLISPLLNYLQDVFRRKKLALFAFFTLLVTTAIYYVIDSIEGISFLALIQGVAFGVTSSTFITLGIDLLPSENRSGGNLILAWYARLGMIMGIAVGSAVYLNYGFDWLLLGALIIGVLGFFFLEMTHVPFRAPIGVKLLSMDRFFLPKTWLLVLNMILITIIPAMLFPLIHFKVRDVFLLDTWSVPYFLLVGIGFVLSMLFAKKVFVGQELRKRILIGLLLIVIAVSLFIIFNTLAGLVVSAVLFGAGLGFVTTDFLLMFINMSSHCERATANYTYLLSWKIGISVGVGLACYLREHASLGATFHYCMLLAALSLFFFIALAYPYYTKRKIR